MAGSGLALRAPFVDLTEFPLRDPVAEGEPLWRVVGNQHTDEPVWFGCAGGRFDLHPLDDDGVCYVGFDPASALLEKGFADASEQTGRLVFTPAMFANRHLRAISTPREVRLAATYDPGVTGFGVTTELASTNRYMLPQWWAQALHAHGPEGCEGVAYQPRHAPGREAAALFGRRGAAPWGAEEPVELDAGRLRFELRGTNVEVLETPASGDNLTVID